MQRFALRKLPIILIFILLACASAMAEDRGSQPGTLHATLDLVKVDGVSVPFQGGIAVPDFEPQDRAILDLGGEWKHYRMKFDHDLSWNDRDADNLQAIENEGNGRHLTVYDDSAWETKTLPSVEDVMPGDELSPPEPYHNGIWYRRQIVVPADWAGRTILFKSLAANYMFDLWVNGVWVGVHEGGYTPFAFDLTDYLDFGKANQFAIRIDKPFPGLRQDQLPSWLAMDWWDYAGMIQDFYLESLDPVHVVRTNVIPLDYNGNILVQVVIANDSNQVQNVRVNITAFYADAESEAYLTDPHPSAIIGEQASLAGDPNQDITVESGDLRVAQFVFRIKSVRRWTPTEPNLYVLKTELAEVGGEMADTHHTQFGVRTVAREDGQLQVNGRVAFFPGVARHEEWPDTGRSATWERIRYDLQVIKKLNALMLRTGHYPNHIYTYLLTDRLGFSTYVEIPAYWNFSWNWRMQNERGLNLQMFREMVLSNYNRPSIMFWGTNNECVFLWNQQIKYTNEMLVNDLRANYNDGRLVTQSPAADPNTWKAMQATVYPVDVAGWTLYYGVFYGDDMYAETVDFIQQHQEVFPEHPMIATEFGYWSEADDSKEQEQADAFTGTWPAFAEMGSLDINGNVNTDGQLAATSWFTVFNWFTKSGLPDFIAPYLQSMGLIHMDRASYKLAAAELAAAYKPYYDFGGLGPEPDDYLGPDDDVDDDATPDDDDAIDDDTTDDDVADDDLAGDDDDDNDDGCGC